MLEATQTAKGESVFASSKEWKGHVVNGTYPLRQYIGGSAHSAVFLTEIPGQNAQRAAIKLIAPSGDTQVQIGGYRLASEVTHSHLLRIFKIGRTHISGEDLLFVVMEYVDESLSQILPQRALTPAEVTDMLKPSLEALAYLHQNGFAHGRIRPTNIMVVGEQLKLSSDGLCRTGAPAGSIEPDAYDPPELSTKGFSPAGDVWSLGVTLAEALTQRFPKWTDRLQKEPSLPEQMAEPFAEIARHCLVRDPRSRWTVAEVSNRLFPPAKVSQQPHGTLKEELRNALRITREAFPLQQFKEWISTIQIVDKWIYAVPIAAMIAIILLLGTLLHRGPASRAQANTASSAPSLRTGKTPAKPSPQTAKTKLMPSTDPGQIVQQVVPNPPEKALRTIKGKIRINIRVYVDADGNIERAQLTTAGPSRYFANLALQCAREWRFTPATREASRWQDSNLRPPP